MKTNGRTLHVAHEALRATLKRAMREPGKTGESARRLANVADGHFLREEKFVQPLLALLPALAAGEAIEGPVLSAAGDTAEGLRAEMEQLVLEHRLIAEAVRRLAADADAEGKPDYVGLAEEVLIHLKGEEEVYYPAALLAADAVRRRRDGGR